MSNETSELKSRPQQLEQALVVGSSGGIGRALVERWAGSGRFDQVWALSRGTRGDPAPATPPGNAIEVATDHSEANIAEQAARILESSPRLSRIVITVGTLHGEDYQPEKSLDALNSASMQAVYAVNCVLPMLWLAALTAGLRRNPDCRIAVLSARVGSIADNQLGGWYSYRSSKAALNMALKCASIELARRAKGVKLIAFHPGTVATDLSKPFQRGVPDGKLFEPEFVAECLDTVLDAHAADGALSYLDWAGETIAW